jgi:UDP-2,4-diacetamido-2,4,6-trideoxy-beta-L-altropyranose hydrolase
MSTTTGTRPSRIVFRFDASLNIGTGHVMRCLTLADALAAGGAECHFLCREHPGNLIEAIRARGYSVHALPVQPAIAPATQEETRPLAHAGWLGASWQDDARQSHEALDGLAPDWLVVDHYALDTRWEQRALPQDCRLLVIDDLADREHCADLLLDQNLGRQADDYAGLVPGCCTRLIGPRYALLRPEFARLRDASLARRATPRLERLLIAMGGVDKDNATGQVLEALTACALPGDCRISVVMGGTAPWLAQVKAQAANMPWPTEVVVNVTDMAERMTQADLAIGAAGSTSWERCCLGLPTLMLALAENQEPIAHHLHAHHAAIHVGNTDMSDWTFQLRETMKRLIADPAQLQEMIHHARDITDGQGVAQVLDALTQCRASELRSHD